MLEFLNRESGRVRRWVYAILRVLILAVLISVSVKNHQMKQALVKGTAKRNDNGNE